MIHLLAAIALALILGGVMLFVMALLLDHVDPPDGML
jgi:hypothetical protein